MKVTPYFVVLPMTFCGCTTNIETTALPHGNTFIARDSLIVACLIGGQEFATQHEFGPQGDIRLPEPGKISMVGLTSSEVAKKTNRLTVDWHAPTPFRLSL